MRQLSLNTGTSITTYAYDGFQRLRVKTQSAPVSTTHYVWNAFGQIIAEHNGTGGAAQKQYIWLGDTPVALFDGANLYYVHPDHLDRPVAMTNSAAMTLAWQAKYEPFSATTTVSALITNNQRLPGQFFQIEDGLAYNWHRSYDPTIGRYTQADPLGFVDGPGIYNYAGGSPVMRVDPTGEQLAEENFKRWGPLPFDYSPRVTPFKPLWKSDPFHNFPTSYDTEICVQGGLSKYKLGSELPVTSIYKQYTLPGYSNGKFGEYQVGFETPFNPFSGYRPLVTHRVFIPYVRQRSPQ